MDVSHAQRTGGASGARHLFPEPKRRTFHRINLEYLVSLKVLDRETIAALLQTGLQGNLSLAGACRETLEGLRPQLDELAEQVNRQSRSLQQVREQLRRELPARTRRRFHGVSGGDGKRFCQPQAQ
ncbi:MAG: hypothetical protein R3E89_00405 [Thiolinea sp.]